MLYLIFYVPYLVQAQVLEHLFQKNLLQSSRSGNLGGNVDFDKLEMGTDATIRESCKIVPRLFESFKKHALSQVCITEVFVKDHRDEHRLFTTAFFMNDEPLSPGFEQGWVMGESLLNPGIVRLCL